MKILGTKRQILPTSFQVGKDSKYLSCSTILILSNYRKGLFSAGECGADKITPQI